MRSYLPACRLPRGLEQRLITASAHTGHDGLLAVQNFQPDLVFPDIGMSQLTAFTAWSDDEARQRVIDAGFDLHLTKPADFDLLLDVRRIG